MVNLLGEAFPGRNTKGMEAMCWLARGTVHLYGKRVTGHSGKMGHVTIVDSDMEKFKGRKPTL